MADTHPCLTSPAAERNKAAILASLQSLLPTSGRLLEIAAGTGQHAVHCAAGLPGWQWQPSDPDPASLQAIAAWSATQPNPGLLPALQFDVLTEPWPAALTDAAAHWDALFCANMLHIAPWACCSALMRGAARVLGPAGQLITYGPYRVQGEPTAPGNQAFDADLRAHNPAWGLRWLHDIAEQAEAVGLQLTERHSMPANNQILVFRRSAMPPERAVIADRQSTHHLTILPGGWHLPVPAGHSLLQAALAAGVHLPSSCRNGSCRTCLARLDSGQIHYSIEWPGLLAEEKTEGWILPCVACADSDLVVTAPGASALMG